MPGIGNNEDMAVSENTIPKDGEHNSNSGAERVRKRVGIFTCERSYEFLLSAFFTGTELYFDMNRDILKMPSNSDYSYFFPKLGKAELSPAAVEKFTPMGDILEISVGSGIIRFSLAIIEEMLKSEPSKLLVRSVMKDGRLQRLGEKLIGAEKTSELARTGEIKMSDDAQFLFSLVSWTMIKAAHSLGLISLGAHDHIGAPALPMLIGQAFAVTSLVATHYGVKNSEELLEFTRKIFTNASDSMNVAKQKSIRSGAIIGQNISVMSSNVTNALKEFDTKMYEWMQKAETYDLKKIIPSPDQFYETILGERIWKALGALAVENEKEEADFSSKT